jgi:capsular polysaccharide transport system permease protein
MTDSNEPNAWSAPANALERAQAISRALADAARRARFSTRARAAYRGGSFRARRGARFIRIMTVTLFVALVALPDLAAIVYFGLIASNQYVSEAVFTVSSGVAPKTDGMGLVTGIPPMLIIQDTQIATNYIESRAMVEQLERTVGLRDAYSSESIDWWARFRKDKPIERFTDYWAKMASAKIALPSGIVTLTVRAFSPEDAKRIADEVVRLSEDVINNLNERMRRDTLLASEREMLESARHLGNARMQMAFERNAEGLINVGETSSAIADLASQLEADLLKANREYQTAIRYVSEDAPQIRVLKSRIAAIQGQLEQTKARLTQSQQSASTADDKSLSGKIPRFAELELEERIAEKRYARSTAAVDSARMLSERRGLYLHEIVAPSLPSEAKYPKRLLSIAVTFLASLIIWGSSVAAITFVRNHMA